MRLSGKRVGICEVGEAESFQRTVYSFTQFHYKFKTALRRKQEKGNETGEPQKRDRRKGEVGGEDVHGSFSMKVILTLFVLCSLAVLAASFVSSRKRKPTPPALPPLAREEFLSSPSLAQLTYFFN